MKTQIAGVVSILVGLVAAVMGAWGFSTTESMAALPAPQSFDSQLWSFHWRVSSFSIAGLGVALVVAGIALFRRKRWGFLLLFVVVAAAAVIPWLFSFAGFSVYAFEQPRILESLLFLVVGIAALLAYGHHMSAVREPNKRIKFAHCVRPTRNGEAPLLAAYARR